jgi:4-hydroxy-tetrahydrodipicolinate synthase
VLGEVSEVGKLSTREQDQIVKTVMERVGRRVPVIVGVSRESTELVIEAAGWAADAGASGLMIAPPKNLKLSGEAILRHYQTVGDAVEKKLPIVVQDEPESDHPVMSAELLARIFDQVRQAKYLKLEDTPTPTKILKLREITGDRIKIFGASHGRWFLWEIDSGVIGIMTGSPTPEYLVGVWRSHSSGDRERARRIFLYNQPLTWFYPEMAVATKKEILVQRGVIRTGLMKQPAREFGDLERKELVEVLSWVEENVAASAGLPPLRPVGATRPRAQ